MGSHRRPWSKRKIRRVLESMFAGGWAAYRSRLGWSVWLSGDGAGPSRRRFFIPDRSLRSRHPRWLGNRLAAAYRQALEGLEGAHRISGTEARDLLRWCTRWVRPRHHYTRSQRQRMARTRRWLELCWRVPTTVQGGGYTAERSRRGWVVAIGSYSGSRRRHYLVPFRALRPNGRTWSGVPLVTALERALAEIEGVARTDDLRGSAPTGWPALARQHAGVARMRVHSPMAGEVWTRRKAG